MLDRTVRFLACLLVALLTITSLAVTPLAAQGGDMQGVVADEGGVTLPNATVTVEGTGLRAVTGANGGYEIHAVPSGTHTVRVHLIGYQAGASSVTIGVGGITRADFTLAKSTVQLAPIDVVVGSRARHTAAEELAVPVDVFPSEQLAQQGSTETSVILQAVSPSINFPRQSVTDAGDIVRPFTLRGLSPDHTLVLLNGWRRHQTALVNNFTYGMGAGSSGVDLNAIPSSALDRIEVLRDGAAAQYGSDAIAGVVNLVVKDGVFAPFVNGDVGRYTTDNYPDDGTTVNVNGGWGIGIGRGSLGLFGEFRDRQATNRAWADPVRGGRHRAAPTRSTTSARWFTRTTRWSSRTTTGATAWRRTRSRFANFRMPVNAGGDQRDLRLRRLQPPRRPGQSHTGATSTAAATGSRSIRSASCPSIEGFVTDYSLAGGLRGVVSGWNYDVGAHVRAQPLRLPDQQHAQRVAGPVPGRGVRTGRRRDPRHRRRSRHPEPDLVLRRPAAARGSDRGGQRRRSRSTWGCGTRSTWRSAPHSGGSVTRSGRASSPRTSTAAPSTRTATARRPAGRSRSPASRPATQSDRHRTNFGLYADAESQLSEKVLADVAARFEDYSDFGSRLSGKAAVRFQPSRRVTLRGAVSTGFRAPGLSQIAFSKVVTNVIGGQFIDVGLFPVDNPASLALGAKPLRDETVGQPQRRHRGDPGGQPHDQRRLLPHPRSTTRSCSAPRSTTRPRWTSWPTRASATSAACSTSPTA